MSWRDSADPTLAKLTCECCKRKEQPVLGVASVPGVAFSAAICGECLQHDCVPDWIAAYWLHDLGLEEMAEWAKAMSVWIGWRYVQLYEYHGWKLPLPAPSA